MKKLLCISTLVFMFSMCCLQTYAQVPVLNDTPKQTEQMLNLNIGGLSQDTSPEQSTEIESKLAEHPGLQVKSVVWNSNTSCTIKYIGSAHIANAIVYLVRSLGYTVTVEE